jgi:hypothetical protein
MQLRQNGVVTMVVIGCRSILIGRIVAELIDQFSLEERAKPKK